MTEWALLREGRIINVVTTSATITTVREWHPNYQVRDLYSLPAEVQRAYRYWDDRP
jgi:hypothetical protein